MLERPFTPGPRPITRLSRVVSGEECASSSRESQSRVLLHKLATGGAENRIDYRYLLRSLWKALLERQAITCLPDVRFANFSALCINAYFKLLALFPLVGPSGNDPLPQDFQSRIRQPTIRQTHLKWLLLLDSNPLYFCFRGRRHNQLGEGAILQIYFSVYKILIFVFSD